MKKLISAICAIVLCASLAACGTTSGNTDKSSSKTASAPVKTEKISTETISALVKENAYCLSIFMSGSLPTKGEAIKDNTFLVDSTKFTTLSELTEYLREVYKEEVVQTLINNYPYEGQPKYLEIDGKLCVDMNRSGNKGYFVDWSNCKIQIDSSDDTSCKFTVTGAITEPSDNPQPEDYNISTNAVYENGKWVLSEMFK